MSRTEWGLLAAIAVVVVIVIAAEPDHREMAGHDLAVVSMDGMPTSTVVHLAVSGMT